MLVNDLSNQVLLLIYLMDNDKMLTKLVGFAIMHPVRYLLNN